MKKAFCGVCLVLLLWITLSTAEVVIHNGNESYVYSKANVWEHVATKTKKCHVIDCEKAGDTWLVTVKDKSDNLWCYYDDTPKAKWHILHVRFKGNAIVDVSE